MLTQHVNLKSNILSLPLQSQRGPLTKQSRLKGDGKTVMTFTVIMNMWLGYINSILTVLLRYQQYFLLCHHYNLQVTKNQLFDMFFLNVRIFFSKGGVCFSTKLESH